MKMSGDKVDLELEFEDGDVIVEEGEPGTEMFIVQEGAVEVVRSLPDEPMLLATLGRGEFFGEMSLLESEPRSATVRAVGKTKVLVLKRGGLLLKIRRDPTFALEMLQHMSRRLRFLNQQIGELLEGRGEIREAELQTIMETSAYQVGRGSDS